jgi:UrcA family protein
MTSNPFEETLMSKTLTPFVGLAIAAASLAFGTAHAAPADDPATGVPAVHVRYSDLHLDTPEGLQTLYRRITIAAREVCPQMGGWQAASSAASRACQARAIERAVRGLNNPRLAAVQEQLNKR